MATEDVGQPTHFATWKPAAGFEPGISTEDDDEDSYEGPVTTRAYLSEFANRPPPGTGYPPRGSFQRPMQRPPNSSTRRKAHDNAFPPKPFGREAYWSASGPKTELRRVAGCSIELPVVAPATAPPEDKALILTQTRNKLSETGTGEWSSKAQLLAQRFIAQVPNALNETKMKLTKLYDWTSDVFIYGQADPYNGDFTPGSFEDRVNLRYLGLEIKINAKNLVSSALDIPDLPQERSIVAYLKIPLDRGQTGIDQRFTTEVMNTGEGIITALKAAGLPVVLGRANKDYSFDTVSFETSFKAITGECEFRTIAAIIARDYIGKAIHSDIHKRLRDCRMIQWTNGQPVIKSVDSQHADFMRLVAEFPATEPITANLPNIAFHNLSRELQLELSSAGYDPPVTCGSNDEQYNQLADFYQKALEAEKKLKQTTSLIRRVAGRQQSNPASSFFTMVSPEDEWQTYENPPDDEWSEGLCQTTWTPSKDYAHAVTMLSLAEKAMRQSSGETAPRECWGCGGMAKYDGQQYHRYARCPHKQDPAVREAAEKFIRLHARKRTSNNQYDRPSNNQYGPGRSNPTSFRPGNQRQFNQQKAETEGPPPPAGKTFLSSAEDPKQTEQDLLQDFGITQERKKLPRCGMLYFIPSTEKQMVAKDADPPQQLQDSHTEQKDLHQVIKEVPEDQPYIQYLQRNQNPPPAERYHWEQRMQGMSSEEKRRALRAAIILTSLKHQSDHKAHEDDGEEKPTNRQGKTTISPDRVSYLETHPSDRWEQPIAHNCTGHNMETSAQAGPTSERAQTRLPCLKIVSRMLTTHKPTTNMVFPCITWIIHGNR